MSKSTSIVVNLLVYIVALLVVTAAWDHLPETHILLRILMADVIGTIVVFVFSVIFNNSSTYDPYWSVQPLVIAVYFAWPLRNLTGPESIVLWLVFLYCLRLTLNFYRGWPGMTHEDWRYRDFRRRFPTFYWPVSLLCIHLFPTLMVFLACLSLWPIFQGGGMRLNVGFFLGLVTMATAIGLALVADEQMRRFRSNPENQQRTMRKGLWKHCRHPNYLGEILTWWGLFFFSLSTGADRWWTIIGPVTVTAMFLGISVPMLEKRQLRRRPGYREYIKAVPRLLPLKFSSDSGATSGFQE